MTKKATVAQLVFNTHDIGGFSEAKANLLRSWYRKGQRAFRSAPAVRSVEYLNDCIQGFKDGSAERDGFLMGWQSDAYAVERGLPLSQEGTDAVNVDDLN